MKVLEFKKVFWFIISLIMIGLAFLCGYLNHFLYENYLEMKEDYVEVDCVVTDVDEVARTITIAYVNPVDGIEYYATFQTIEYELNDSFVGAIKPEEPTKLRFDNGYSHYNAYTFTAIILLAFAGLIILVIIKRLFVRTICMSADKVTLSGLTLKHWQNFHILIVNYNGKKYRSEIFRTFQNIHFLDPNTTIDLYVRGPFHYLDLASYQKVYQ